MKLTRRGLFTAGAAFLAAPSIVRVSNLMPISTKASDFGPLLIGIDPAYGDSLTEQYVYLINTKYYALYLSEDAPVEFSGFYAGPNA